jgi:16S rRNA (adenine1518-N6/adenine1519-N6)-dimethyltransferase
MPFTSSELQAIGRTLRLKKRFDQNFLVDAAIIAKIVEAVERFQANNPTLALIEVGPGAGFLTQALLEIIPPNASALCAIELERAMVSYLQEQFGHHPKLNLQPGDVLSYDFSQIDAEHFQIVGNLPYSVATPLIFKLVGELTATAPPLAERLLQMTVMVQKEVGERMMAEASGKPYGQKSLKACAPLSLACQRAFEVKPLVKVPPKAFVPPPKVDSLVMTLTLKPKDQWQYPKDAIRFARLVKAGFQQRRKTLVNALAHGGGTNPQAVQHTLQLLDLPADVRAEALSLSQWIALSDTLSG